MSTSTGVPTKAEMATSYTTAEVAKTVGLTPARIRGLVRRQLLAPTRIGGSYRFSFQDLALLKAAKNLLEADVPSRRAFAALTKLKDRLVESGKPLSAMRISAAGGAVVVRDGDALWNAETGQGHLPFAAEPLGEVRRLATGSRNAKASVAGPATPALAGASRKALGKTEELDSDDWYNLALDFEDSEPAKAPDAYGRAIALNANNADAHVNLGRLLQVDGDLRRATRHYQAALAAVPEHQLAYYNLGTVFDELGELNKAMSFYRQAPGVPDAHYNLARIFDLRGDELASLRHMRKYKAMLSKRGLDGKR